MERDLYEERETACEEEELRFSDDVFLRRDEFRIDDDGNEVEDDGDAAVDSHDLVGMSLEDEKIAAEAGDGGEDEEPQAKEPSNLAQLRKRLNNDLEIPEYSRKNVTIHYDDGKAYTGKVVGKSKNTKDRYVFLTHGGKMHVLSLDRVKL